MARSGVRGAADDGSATLEFIALTLVLLIPLVYLVIAVGRIQAGTFAAQASARDAARGAVVQGVAALEGGASDADAQVAAESFARAASDVALADFGLGTATNTVELACSDFPCFAPGSEVIAQVTVSVPLPGVPAFLNGAIPLAVTVSADSASPVAGIAGASGTANRAGAAP
ncbi:pilus assembly protein [Demequina aurantiaca]|uniref:pilus assembly protein n=1 Tax=Demequina aurantiaca TaxID=676200 RepID=UPI003D32EBD7